MKEMKFSSLKAFMEWKLDRYSEYGDQNPLRDMVFRGHSDSSYKLIPSALRSPILSDPLSQFGSFCINRECKIFEENNIKNSGIIKNEINHLKQFYIEANRYGCNLPPTQEFSVNYFSKYNREYIKTLESWYDPHILEIAALAQHNGFPTRLLDWTFDIYVAFYFALQGVVKKQFEGSEIPDYYTIWAVDPGFIVMIDEAQPEKCPIKFFVPNYSGNENLRAQSGVLSYHRIEKKNFDDTYKEETIDELIIASRNESIGENSKERVPWKINFSTKNAVNDFEYICQNGYNAARLFPGFNGIIRKLQEDYWIEFLKKRRDFV